MTQIFISYRRKDSGGYVGRIHEHLQGTEEFRDGGVFFDLSSIDPGVDFIKRIEAAISVSDVVVVVIGEDWLDLRDADAKRRLDDPADPVRTEIALALELGIPVLPLLVGGAAMPKAEDLPAGIGALSRQNALAITNARFALDFEELRKAIARLAAAREKPVENPAKHVDALDYLALGNHFLYQKDYPNARSCLTAAVVKKPDLAAAHVGLARCFQLEAFSQSLRLNFGFAADLLDAAEERIREALQYEDADPAFFVQLGYVRKEIAQVFQRLGRKDRVEKANEKARTHFKMALGINDHNASAWNGLASLAIVARRWDEAIEASQHALEIEPDYASARHDLVMARYGKVTAAPEPKQRLVAMKEFLEDYRNLVLHQEKPDAERLPPDALQNLQGMANAVVAEVERLLGQA